MSTAIPITNHATGTRRMSLTMLAARDRADGFCGLPRGSAKPLLILAAFQAAEPYLGLPSLAFKLISWLVQKTQPQDWEEGSRPMAWPSAREQQEYLGLSAARVKVLNRALYEAGIFVLRDNEQGKRYGRRHKVTGKIIEAFGFDLSPLAQRHEEFIRLAADARLERDRMKKLRRRITLARRAVAQAGAMLAGLDQVPEFWPQLEGDIATLLHAARKAAGSDELALIAGTIERRKDQAEQALRDASKSVSTNPVGLENELHTTTTNLTNLNPTDTVVASEDRSPSGAAVPEPKDHPSPQPLVDPSYRINPWQLLELAPRLAHYLEGRDPTWSNVDNAAYWLRGELGISSSLWNDACQLMGHKHAAVALAIVSTKPASHFQRSAGGYFSGMVKKALKGELRLERTIWKLREEKWGKRDQHGKGWLN